MSLKSLIHSIGAFFENLFKNTAADFNNLPKEQQDAIIQGVNISQIIKTGYAKGEAFVVNEIASTLNVFPDVASAVILEVGKGFGIDTGKVQDVLNHFADKVQAGITDNGWNGLWQNVAQFAASYMATGSLNWVTLALGVVEFAVQHYLKGVK